MVLMGNFLMSLRMSDCYVNVCKQPVRLVFLDGIMSSWQLQTAKAQLSKVVQEAIIHGPQEILLRGEPAVMVVSKKDFNKLLKPKISFVEFMRRSPWVGVKLRLSRDTSLTREVKL